MSSAEIKAMEDRLNPVSGDIIFFSANDFVKAVKILNVVRLALRDKFDLADKNTLAFCWVKDFPMFEESEINGKLDF
jgi:aspartyl-tRNA synthetase